MYTYIEGACVIHIWICCKYTKYNPSCWISAIFKELADIYGTIVFAKYGSGVAP